MKKFIAIMVSLLLTISCWAYAESGVIALDDSLFRAAKDTLLLFEKNDFEGAASLLAFGTADEFEKFVSGNYKTFGAEPVQTVVSVAWLNGGAWQIAVPLHEPVSGDIETLVLVTDNIDCTAFCGYRYADWEYVETEISCSDYVIWNEEYVAAESMIIYTDD